jgi:hypothetical protein
MPFHLTRVAKLSLQTPSSFYTAVMNSRIAFTTESLEETRKYYTVPMSFTQECASSHAHLAALC